jgi:transcriptional regulator NrdR family protein
MSERKRRERGTPAPEYRVFDCPRCGSVRIVTYHMRDGYRVRRRLRHCQRCGHNFPTIEVTAEMLESIWRDPAPA